MHRKLRETGGGVKEKSRMEDRGWKMEDRGWVSSNPVLHHSITPISSVESAAAL
jgi:hypothetical protein